MFRIAPYLCGEPDDQPMTVSGVSMNRRHQLECGQPARRGEREHRAVDDAVAAATAASTTTVIQMT